MRGDPAISPFNLPRHGCIIGRDPIERAESAYLPGAGTLTEWLAGQTAGLQPSKMGQQQSGQGVRKGRAAASKDANKDQPIARKRRKKLQPDQKCSAEGCDEDLKLTARNDGEHPLCEKHKRAASARCKDGAVVCFCFYCNKAHGVEEFTHKTNICDRQYLRRRAAAAQKNDKAGGGGGGPASTTAAVLPGSQMQFKAAKKTAAKRSTLSTTLAAKARRDKDAEVVSTAVAGDVKRPDEGSDTGTVSEEERPESALSGATAVSDFTLPVAGFPGQVPHPHLFGAAGSHFLTALMQRIKGMV